MKKRKILYLITKSNWGGAQRYVYDLATSLPTDRFEVTVALGGDGPLKNELTTARIRVISIPGLQRDISISKELRSFRAIWDVIKTEQPDILHVNSSKAGGLGALCGRFLGVPKIIYSAHGWAFNEDRGVIGKFIVGFFHWQTVMLAHTTIAVSKAVKQQMHWPFTQRKIAVVQNGREPIPFLTREAAREKCIAKCSALERYTDDLWSVTIAELHPVKCHSVAIAAIKQLVTEGITIRHIIIGDGELQEKLTEQITEANLQDHVFLLGHMPEAAQLLTAFDIFILPSRSEAIGYAVIEASQAGLPIVASRVGGIPEIISNGWDGILVPAGDSGALYTVLKDLVHDQNTRDKIAAAAIVRGRHFSKERMVIETSTLYNL